MAFLNTMKMKFSFDTEFFESIFDDEQVVQDVLADYTISGLGTFKFKFLDTKYLYDGVTFFRPFIRGFLVLMMALFHIRMVLSFIRQDAGVVAGKSVSMSNRKEQ